MRQLKRFFGEVRNLQGKITEQMNALGFSTKQEASLITLNYARLHSKLS